MKISKCFKRFIAVSLFSLSLSITVINPSNLSNSSLEVAAYYSPSTTYTNGDADTYYTSIDASLTGTDLLNKLQSLNSSRRKKTMGYKSMGTSASTSPFVYTDYDPNTATKDSNGQPYGTKLLSFYSGTSMTSYNKEHVWPNSRGGGQVENDIHMPRPTIAAENTNRGNSSFVEGKAHNSEGWDPVTAFGASNCYQGENIRGECARIIFYCMVASNNLTLKDNADTSYNKSIGKLSDMLKWNLKYAVNEREERRNEGAEYLQGNRNPFVDHPEYACRIWGNTNSATKSICGEYVPDNNPTSIEINNKKEAMGVDEKYTLEVNVLPSNASQEVTISSSDSNVIEIIDNKIIHSLSEGKATITVSSTILPSIKTSFEITVSKDNKSTDDDKNDDKENNNSNIGLIIGLSVGGGILLVGGFAVAFIILRKKKII